MTGFRLGGLLLVAWLGCPVLLSGQSRLSAEAWREDLGFLAARLPAVHPDLFHHVTPEDFATAVRRLNEKIPELEPHQILIELARLTALVREGHTGIQVSRQPRDLLATLHAFPVRFHAFPDALIVTAADTSYQFAVGLRVIRVGTVTADEALRRVGEIIPADNPQWIRRQVPSHLAVAEVLHALGISPSRQEVDLRLAGPDGSERTITLMSRPLPELTAYLSPLSEPLVRSDVVLARTRMSTVPLWLKAQRSRYRLEFLPDSRMLYLQINTMLDQPGESLEHFYHRALQLADSLNPDRLVIDLRQNNGGNNLALPLVHGLIRRPSLDREGRLFVLIGPGTVSAGQHLATMLDRHTNAVFVGEPTASRPNHYGVVGTFSLPHSRIFVWHSRLLVQDADPGDFRPWQAPDIAAPISSADYAAGRDPALDAVVAYRPMPALADTLEAVYRGGGLDRMLEAFRLLAPQYRQTGRSIEGDLNRMGYLLLALRKSDDALAVFSLNVTEHPESFNVYDSLGDAQIRSGRRAEGLASYRRSVELNPGNAHARRVLRAETVTPP